MFFKDRHDAGIKLAQKLSIYAKDKNAVVIGLPRGGIVVAQVIAQKLNLPLDIIVTRKIGAPYTPELALGALTQEGEPMLDKKLLDMTNYKKEDLKDTIEKEKKELERRMKLYRKDYLEVDLKNKIVILIDDGMATGCTMRAAIKSVKNKGAKKVIVAIPVGPLDVCDQLKNEVSSVICIHKPITFDAIGIYYDNFEQIEDDQVIKLLGESGKE
ncbi:hypothetical protein KAT08_00965 [Candidatus Babeliales bacterium]|nr:hypothetical protein [Candidatus Babeliales bacterium]